MLVNLTYFKPSGKSYTSASYETPLTPTAALFEVWDEVAAMMRAKRFPGLVEGAGEEFSVLVDVPDHPNRHLRLLTPDALTSDTPAVQSAEIDAAYRAGFTQGKKIGSDPVTPCFSEREVSAALDRWTLAYCEAVTARTPHSPGEPRDPHRLGLVDALYVRLHDVVGTWISREFSRLEQCETREATLEITVQAPKMDTGEIRCEIQSSSRSVDYPNAARIGSRRL